MRERHRLVSGLEENVHKMVGGFIREFDISNRDSFACSVIQHLLVRAHPSNPVVMLKPTTLESSCNLELNAALLSHCNERIHVPWLACMRWCWWRTLVTENT